MIKEPTVVHIVVTGKIDQICLITSDQAEAEAEYQAIRATNPNVELLSILQDANIVVESKGHLRSEGAAPKSV